MQRPAFHPTRLLAAMALAAALPAAQAQQGVNLTAGPVDYTTWTLFGSAVATNSTPGNGYTYSVLDLTLPGSGDQAGAAFAPVALMLDFNQGFRFDFNWYITGAPDSVRGDGFTFRSKPCIVLPSACPACWPPWPWPPRCQPRRPSRAST